MSFSRAITGTDINGLAFLATGGSESNALSDWLAGMGRSTAPAIKAFWADIDGTPPNIERWRDRVFIGDATNILNTSANASQNTFIPSAFSGPNWLLRDSQFAVGTDRGTSAILGYAQSANTPTNRAAIGIAGFTRNNSNVNAVAWGAYFEVSHENTTSTATMGMELDARNVTSSNYSSDPYGATSGAFGFWIAGGGGQGYGTDMQQTNGATSTASNVLSFASVPSYITAGQTVLNQSKQIIGIVASTTSTTVVLVANAAFAVANGDNLHISFGPNAAVTITQNLHPWNEGILFRNGSLTSDSEGNAIALSMYSGAAIQWYTAAATKAGSITSQTAHQIQLGGLDSATPSAQTISSQNTLTGTSNTIGGGLIFAPGKGTGTGASGNITFQSGAGGSTGSTQNALGTAMTFVGSSQTLVLSSSLTLLPLANNTITPRFYINSVATTNQNGAAFLNYRAAANAPSTLYLGLSRGTVINTQGAVVSGDQLGQVVGEGNDGTHFQDSSVIQFVADASVSSGIVPGRTVFLTANSSGSMTEAFRIDSSQQLQFASAGITANGAVATLLGSLGPTGSHTTVQEWLVVKNASGTIRYIPMF